jgi:hypothetical protein
VEVAVSRPVRIQRKRTPGWRMPPDTVSVDRSTEWGNPYRVYRTVEEKTGAVEWWVEGDDGVWRFKTKEEAVAKAVALFTAWLEHPAREKHRARARLALRGKNLACWCPEGSACHGDALLRLANGG